MGTAYTKKDIPTIRQKIEYAKNWVVGSQTTPEQKQKLTEKIVELEKKIDYLERGIQKKDGTKTYDYDAFQKDMIEHYQKAQAALKEAEQYLPDYWMLSAKQCTGKTIAAKDFKNAQRYLLTVDTQLKAYSGIAEMFLISCQKTKENKTLCIKDDLEEIGKKRYYEDMNRKVEELTKSYKVMKAFADGLSVDPKALTKDAVKKKKQKDQAEESTTKAVKEAFQSVIKKGKMEWKSKTIATIKWGSQSKTIELTNLKAPYIEKDIPHDVSGSLEILYKHAFFYDGEDTKYRHTKRIVCSFVVDKKGGVSLTKPNEKEVSSAQDFITALGEKLSDTVDRLEEWAPSSFIEAGKKIHDTDIKKLIKNVKKEVIEFFKKTYGKGSFSASYNSDIYSSGRLKGVSTAYVVKMPSISISGGITADVGIEIPFKATGDASGSFTIEIPESTGNASGSISLMSREVPISQKNKPEDGQIIFEKEGQFDLDDKLEAQIHQFWKRELKRFENKLLQEEKAKNGKNKDAKALLSAAQDKLDELIYKQKKYSIYLQGFASSTGDQSSNEALSNKRAKKVVDYLVNQLNLQSSNIFLKAPDGKYQCKEEYGDNQASKACKKVIVQIKLGG